MPNSKKESAKGRAERLKLKSVAMKRKHHENEKMIEAACQIHQASLVMLRELGVVFGEGTLLRGGESQTQAANAAQLELMSATATVAAAVEQVGGAAGERSGGGESPALPSGHSSLEQEEEEEEEEEEDKTPADETPTDDVEDMGELAAAARVDADESDSAVVVQQPANDDAAAVEAPHPGKIACVNKFFSEVDKLSAAHFAALFNAQMSDDWLDDATHVVTGSDFDADGDVSGEFLLGLLMGKKQVVVAWLRDCVEAGRLLPTGPYEMALTQSGERSDGRRIFDKYHFYVTQLDTSKKLPRAVLVKLLSLTGGTLHDDAEVMKAGRANGTMAAELCFVVYPAGSRRSKPRAVTAKLVFDAMEVRVIDAAFILESITNDYADPQHRNRFVFPA